MHYDIEHSCGHTQNHFFFRDASRDRVIVLRFTRQLCSECKKAERTKGKVAKQSRNRRLSKANVHATDSDVHVRNEMTPSPPGGSQFEVKAFLQQHDDAMRACEHVLKLVWSGKAFGNERARQEIMTSRALLESFVIEDGCVKWMRKGGSPENN